MSMRLSEHATFHDLDNLAGSDGEPGRQDIGNTNAQTDWVSMASFARAVAFAVLGTWHATDDLDESKIQSSDDSSGSNTAEVTTDASGGNYDTDSPIDADGDFIVTEIRAEDIDVENTNPQLFVRYYVAEGGNTGTDNVAAMLTRYGHSYAQKELQGAASTGSQVYVDPGT
jgi:hypothetical protein